VPVPADATVDPGELLRQALADPRAAEARADALLSTRTDPWTLSVAHHVRGLVLRERGRMAEAIGELRTAVRQARRSSDPDRLADVRATLGAALVMDGHPRAGLDQLTRAVAGAEDLHVRATARMRRGAVLSLILARHEEAKPDLRAALSGARRLGDRVWEARTLSNLSTIHLATGDVAAASRLLADAHRIFESEGQRIEAMITRHSQGQLAFFSGDLPAALRCFDEVEDACARWGEPTVEVGRDRCQALLAAGLPDEARDVATGMLQGEGIHAFLRAELELVLAWTEIARGDVRAALGSARAARDRFHRQGRRLDAARAELVVLGARRLSGHSGPSLAARTERVARTLEAARSEDAPTAWLLAGRTASAVDSDRAAELWGAAGRYRRHPSGLVRATAWLAEGLRREQRADGRGIRHACRRGLDALDEHRATLGSTELRVLASLRGDDLARLALAHAVGSRPRTFLWWSERWRATSLALPPLRPPGDAELSGLLAAFRVNSRRLAEARAVGEPTAVMDRERARLERAIQHRRRLVGATDGTGPLQAGLDVDRLVDEIGDSAFVELVEVDGHLRSIVVCRGRVRAYAVGSAADAAAAVASARFVLRQAARGRPVRLGDVRMRLQDTLLGPSVAAIGSGPVVVSPTASLHAAPWGLLPALSGAPFTVVPTASAWLRARGESEPTGTGRVLVAGPGLASGGAEVPLVAADHPGSVVLRDGSATVERCLEAMDGAALVHVAAHGRFRADNPMFSALELDDGPLTVHDLERLSRAPHRFVLSACDSGVLVPVGAHELLGLATALMSMGTAGILSSVAPVNDEATAELMVGVHRALDEADDLGVAMLRVRDHARADVVGEATAAAFVPLGV
jgi:tetratricopeptide (TPR) repeat protein